MTAYSPLGSADSASLLGRDARTLLQNETLLDIAKELERSPAEVNLAIGMALLIKQSVECGSLGLL